MLFLNFIVDKKLFVIAAWFGSESSVLYVVTKDIRTGSDRGHQLLTFFLHMLYLFIFLFIFCGTSVVFTLNLVNLKKFNNVFME